MMETTHLPTQKSILTAVVAEGETYVHGTFSIDSLPAQNIRWEVGS